MIDSLSILFPGCMSLLVFPYEVCVEFLCCCVQLSWRPLLDSLYNPFYKVPKTTLQSFMEWSRPMQEPALKK